jgi:uncharacterized membrane protein YeaQ/YmgE (transglycosylase-associated protein family)
VLVVCRTFPNAVMGWVGALVVGLLGGWLGGWLADVVGLEAVNWLGALIVAFAGALGILLLLQRVAPERR